MTHAEELPRPPHPHPPRARPAAQNWLQSGTVGTPRILVGLTLVGAFALQALLGWRWAWLSSLQENETYKQLTGLALVLLFAMQWRLWVARVKGATRKLRSYLVSHLNCGMLAPLLLYVHADSFGHAYLRAMSLAFLGLVFLGLLYRPMGRLGPRWLGAWVIGHMTLATSLVVLLGYHVFMAFHYE